MRTSAVSNLRDRDELTDLERIFVENIAAGMTQHAAANQCGISAPTARNYLDSPHIRRALNARREELRAQFRLTREDVVKGFLSAIDDAKLLSDPGAQITGWREIGRMLGHYEPERKIIELSTNADEALVQLQGMDLENLTRLAGLGDEALEGEFTLVEEVPDPPGSPGPQQAPLTAPREVPGES